MSENNKKIVQRYFGAIASKDFEAACKLVGDEFVQHFPKELKGRDELKDFLISWKIKTHIQYRFIADDDLVVVHSRVQGGPKPIITFTLLKVTNQLINEIWEFSQEEVSETSSGRTQIDGPVDIKEFGETEKNRNLLKGFCDHILLGGEFNRVSEFISTSNYHQHNPQVGDELSGFGAAMAELHKHGMGMHYHKVHHLLAEGEFVFLASEGEFGPPGKLVRFADLFRVKDSKIVEHWDVIHPLSV